MVILLFLCNTEEEIVHYRLHVPGVYESVQFWQFTLFIDPSIFQFIIIHIQIRDDAAQILQRFHS